jgi:hypothetical protein
MLMLNVLMAICVEAAESWAWRVKEYCPDAVGVPIIVPVEALSARPGGNEPRITLQL